LKESFSSSAAPDKVAERKNVDMQNTTFFTMVMKQAVQPIQPVRLRLKSHAGQNCKCLTARLKTPSLVAAEACRVVAFGAKTGHEAPFSL
jgi:hypothetical protein